VMLLVAGVAIVAGLVVTAPVLMVVDSSTLDRKDSAKQRHLRVAASFCYFGVLGVALCEALRQETPSLSAPMLVWPTSALSYVVFIWCFSAVYVFSVVITTLYAYRKQKLYFGVIAAAIAPPIVRILIWNDISFTAVLSSGLAFCHMLLQHSGWRGSDPNGLQLEEFYGVLNTSNLSGLCISSLLPDNTTTAMGANLWAVVSTAMVACGASTIAIIVLFCIMVAFTTEWRGLARVLYCFMVATMLWGGEISGMRLVWIADILKWLHLGRVLSWAYCLVEVTLLVVLPISWVVFSRDESGINRTTRTVLTALSPTVLFAVVNSSS